MMGRQKKLPGPPQTFGHNSHYYQTIGERQKEIIALISIGKEYRDIAEMLGVKRFTVERHIQRAKDATGCPTLPALVAHCIRRGVIQ